MKAAIGTTELLILFLAAILLLLPLWRRIDRWLGRGGRID